MISDSFVVVWFKYNFNLFRYSFIRFKQNLIVKKSYLFSSFRIWFVKIKEVGWAWEDTIEGCDESWGELDGIVVIFNIWSVEEEGEEEGGEEEEVLL